MSADQKHQPIVLTWIVLTVVLSGGLIGWRLYQKARQTRFHVVLYLKDKPLPVVTTQTTVGGLLKEQGFQLKPQDVVVPPLDAPVTAGLEVDLGLVERRVKEIKKKTPFSTLREYTDTLNVGEVIDLQPGTDGLEDQTVESFYLNGEETFLKVVKSKVLVPTKNAKVLEGTALKQKLYPLTKRVRVWKTLTLEATAYYPGPEDTWPWASGTTASGLKAGYGVAAVDTRLIKLKTPLYIEGYGYAIAADRGGAIKGGKIDLCFDTYEEAVRFGRKKVKVYLLR